MFRFVENILDLFIPNECLCCHTPLKRGEKALCLVCQSKLPRTRSDKPDNEAEHRMFGKMPFVHGTSFCYYRKDGEFANLIRKAKYHDMPWINFELTKLFAAELSMSGWPYDIDIIVPVPIHFVRKIIRGYNQSLPIAEALTKAWNVPVESNCLKKKTYTKSQVSRSAQERLSAVEGSFILSHPERLAGKHVLLVDDVLTTGATLDACSQLLVSTGAKVSFLTLGLSN